VLLLQTLCKSTCCHYFSPYTKGDTAIKNRLHHVNVTCLNPMTMRFVCGWLWCNLWLSRRSAAARLLRSWVRIPPGVWLFFCCVLSGRGPCDKFINRLEDSYPLWCVVECNQETSRMRRPWPAFGSSATGEKIDEYPQAVRLIPQISHFLTPNI